MKLGVNWAQKERKTVIFLFLFFLLAYVCISVLSISVEESTLPEIVVMHICLCPCRASFGEFYSSLFLLFFSSFFSLLRDSVYRFSQLTVLCYFFFLFFSSSFPFPSASCGSNIYCFLEIMIIIIIHHFQSRKYREQLKALYNSNTLSI